MKNKLLILLMIAFSAQAWSQEGPVAVNDYFTSALGETITVNVVANDSHPEGLNIRIVAAGDAQSFTDSTITYFLDYELYYNFPDTITFHYILVDEAGLSGYNAFGFVYIVINNHQYYNELDLNNIRAYISAGGIQFWPMYHGEETDGNFEFPKGSSKNTIFSSSLWIGGLDEFDSLKLAAETYRIPGMDFWTGPLSNNESELSIDLETVINWYRVWKLTREEIEYHKQHYLEEGYEILSDIASWPAHGDEDLNQAMDLAPFVDVDGDGVYNPVQGDYPLIRGDQCIYFIMNDLKKHYETKGKALGLEIQVMAYEFSRNGISPLDNTLFLSYKIYNRSASTYHNTYLGVFTDFDIGSPYDDYVGCDVARSTYYSYNGDEYDEGHYGNIIPAQAVVLLGGPMMDDNGIDDSKDYCDESINGIGFSDGITDNERFGMSGFAFIKNYYWYDSLYSTGRPDVDYEFYNCLNSLWKDGTTIEYGGLGSPADGSYGPSTKFMFPGLTDPCYWGTSGDQPNGPVNWTENSAGNAPGDRSGQGIMGPFTFEPGTMERIDIAYVASFADPGETAVETLMRSVDEVRAKYLENPTYFGYQWLGMEEKQIDPQENKLVVYPNPVNSQLTFNYNVTDTKADYLLTDIMGIVILHGTLDNREQHIIDVSKLKTGIYILTVLTVNGNYTSRVIKAK